MAARLAVDGGEPVRRQPWPPRRLFGPAERAAALAVLDRCVAEGTVYGYGGAESRRYAERFVEFMGGGFAHPVNSGTAAVFAALAACELPPFSEVVVPPITDPGGVMPVALLNLVPVVADAAPGSFNAGPAQIATAVTERTSAVVVAHIAGEPVDVEAVRDLVGDGIAVIEDAAQAHGATCRGRLAGTLGDIAAFSTMSGKHHASGGQGGIIYARDEQRFLRARRFADRGKPVGLTDSTNVTAGLNCNQDDLSCAIGAVQLERLPQIGAGRRAFAALVGERLSAVDGLDLGRREPDTEPSYWFQRLRLDPARGIDLGRFVRALGAEGVPVGWPYALLTPETTWFREQRVFGRPGWPWQAPEYAGDRRPSYALPNARAARAEHCILHAHERCGEREADDLAAAASKVLAAYS